MLIEHFREQWGWHELTCARAMAMCLPAYRAMHKTTVESPLDAEAVVAWNNLAAKLIKAEQVHAMRKSRQTWRKALQGETILGY